MQELDLVVEELRRFTSDRDWARFHTPRNLAMALAGEVGELLAEIQWIRSEDMEAWLTDPQHVEALRHEIADVFAYLLQFADATGIDPVEALAEKIRLNGLKYPVEKARGSSAKYTELQPDEDSE